MKIQSVSIGSLLLLLLALFAPVTQANANSQDVRIRLTASSDFPTAKGTAKYRDRGGERSFQAEVEVPARLAGATYAVVVGQAQVGVATINTLGNGRLSLSTKLGNSVPRVVPGTWVRFVTPTGATVVSGKF